MSSDKIAAGLTAATLVKQSGKAIPTWKQRQNPFNLRMRRAT